MFLISLKPITLLLVYYSTFLCDVILVLWCHWEASNGVSHPKVDLDAYYHEHSETFSKILDKRFHHIDIAVLDVIFISDIGVGVVVPETALDLNITSLEIASGPKSIEGPCRVPAPK